MSRLRNIRRTIIYIFPVVFYGYEKLFDRLQLFSFLGGQEKMACEKKNVRGKRTDSLSIITKSFSR